MHRNEASLEIILDSIRRVESQVNDIQARHADQSISHDIPTSTLADPVSHSPRHGRDLEDNIVDPIAKQDGLQSMTGSRISNQAPIPYSAHQVLSWPVILDILPEGVTAIYHSMGGDYSTNLELEREAFTPDITPLADHDGGDWLTGLSISVVRELADSYFSTFNLICPLLDRTFFFRNTLGAVLGAGFRNNIETCLALITMALGCRGVKCQLEFDSESRTEESRSGTGSSNREGIKRPSRELMSLLDEETVGLRFFNECRKRIGYLDCENSLQSSQYYYLSALVVAWI
jgi:hypothetical protein